MTWQVFADPPEVMPVDDLKPHEFGDWCWCGPTWNDDVLVHHSMDRREEYERGRLPS